MPAWLLAVLAVGATFRLTRLVVEDRITRPIRRWADARLGDADEPGGLAYLLTCPWCFSMYVCGPVAVAVVWWGDNRVVQAGVLALTASAGAGLIATHFDVAPELRIHVDDEPPPPESD